MGDILADGLEIKGTRIEVVPAYNIDKPYHPRGLGVGYIVELEGLGLSRRNSDLFQRLRLSMPI